MLASSFSRISFVSMGLFRSASLVCDNHLHCSEWARVYLKFCLCSLKDSVSLTLGLVSVLSWGFAEVPQICSNYRHKSTEGLSIAFLSTWIIGDFFNLFGCLLEPATLPTQYYMAVLYTLNSLVLFTQTVYYGHIYHRGKMQHFQVVSSVNSDEGNNDSEQKVKDLGDGGSVAGVPHTSPIPITLSALHVRQPYYKSARLLSRSYSPDTAFFNKRTTRSTIDHSNNAEEPLLFGESLAAQSAPPVKTKTMLCVISLATFFFSSFNLRPNNRLQTLIENQNRGVVIGARRTLLKASYALPDGNGDIGNSGIGSLLGWAMAVIYMGGRLPQICLNIRRGNLKGLSLGMFIFALVGNVTYIASILVNSLDWAKLQPNLPWLVDAGGCSLLDTFILIQFMYFHSRRPEIDRTNI